MNTCATCRHFNYKSQATDMSCWGECLNEEVFRATHILCLPPRYWEGDWGRFATSVADYARVRYREDAFGCIFHEGKEAAHG